MTDVYTELHYQNFMPIGSPSIPYYLRRQEWDYCALQLIPSALGFGALTTTVSTSVTPALTKSDFYVDVMFLTGKVGLYNFEGDAVPVDTETTYKAFDAQELSLKDSVGQGDSDIAINYYDFNRDGQSDYVVNGKVKAIDLGEGQLVETFIPVADPNHWAGDDEIEHQAIYFDADSAQEGNPPDLIRIADTEKRISKPVGILESISADDYKNTDILVFRESTGQLIVQRRGLRDGEIDINQTIGYDDQAQKAASENSSLLSVAVPEIALLPPNLKIWAERHYDVEQGLTQGEDRHYIIGSEGAGLTSDTTITLYTQWLDHDGSPLPEGLGLGFGADFGLTGRLAKITSHNTLTR